MSFKADELIAEFKKLDFHAAQDFIDQITELAELTNKTQEEVNGLEEKIKSANDLLAEHKDKIDELEEKIKFLESDIIDKDIKIQRLESDLDPLV